MCFRNVLNLVFLKALKQTQFSSYSREITIALLVKFLLLGGLWWLFFAGNKHPVDEVSMAGKLFGERNAFIFSKNNQERF